MSSERIDQPFAKLRQAFDAFEKSEVRSPHRDPGNCLTLVHLGYLAADAGLTSSADVHHLKNCRKCSVRLSTMQSELGTDPKTRFEQALAEDRRELSRFAIAEPQACNLFHRLHAHREDPDRHSIWSEVHSTVQALRGHHSPGDEEDVKSIVVMTSTAVRSVLADALTPFAWSLDAAWPIVLMMARTGIEAARHGVSLAARFACGYAEIIHGAPAPLKAALTYGIGKLLRHDPQLQRIAIDIVIQLVRYNDPATFSILTMLCDTEAPKLKLVVQPETCVEADPRLTSINASLKELAERVRVQGDLSGIVSTVQINSCELLAKTLEDGDTTLKLQQLLLTRYYLSSAASQVNERWPNTLDRFHYLGGIVNAVMRDAQYADHQYFVATEIISAIGANPSAIRFMAEMLDIPDHSLRQALFVYFLELADSVPFRFVGEGNNWVFESAAEVPIGVFGNRAAAMAKEDSEIAELIEWSHLHQTCMKALSKQSAKA
jgi:hypothetical protein